MRAVERFASSRFWVRISVPTMYIASSAKISGCTVLPFFYLGGYESLYRTFVLNTSDIKSENEWLANRFLTREKSRAEPDRDRWCKPGRQRARCIAGA